MANRYWVGNGGNWSDTAHWAESSNGAGGKSVPTSSTNVYFDENSFNSDSQTVNVDLLPAVCYTLNFTGVTNNPSFIINSSKGINVYGNLILNSDMTFGDGNGYLWMQAGTITTNDVTINTNLIIGNPTAWVTNTFTLLDNLSINGDLTIYWGTFEANDFNITAKSLLYDNNNENSITINMGSGIWTFNPDIGDIVWTSDTQDQIINAEDSTVIINIPSGATGGNAIIFLQRADSLTLNNIILDGQNNDGEFYFYSPTTLTCDEFTIQNAPITVYFHSGVNYNFDTFTAHGTKGNLITLTWWNGAIQYQINSSSVSISYVNVANSVAYGSAEPFTDYPGGVDSGNNTNWLFSRIVGTLPIYNPSIISSVNRVQQNIGLPQFIIGGQGTGSEYALFKKGATYDFTVWRSSVYQIGKNFDVLEIKFAVVGGITANKAIIPVLYFDHEATNSIGAVINATNYPNSEKLIKLTSKNFGNAVHGRNNFFLELQFTGTALAVVKLPIEIIVDVLE